jgi:hypothetical protein
VRPADARDEAAVLAELVGRLLGLEGEGRVEVREADHEEEEDDGVERAALAQPVDDDVGDVLDDPARGAEVGGHLDGEEEDADGEDDGDDTGLIDAQRQERRATLVHAPTAHAAGVLDGDASLAFLDVCRR